MSVQASALNLQPSIVTTSAGRRRALTVILMVAIAGIFWVDSRYPALLKRYNAGTHVKAAGALTFGTVYEVDRSMPLSTRVWRTTVNWLDANRIGMTFSFLFGPAALVFLATVPRRRTGSKYLNTLLGAIAGMPIAVCTNCVAQIARGLYAAGMSRESVLAAMFASPALNVVVLVARVGAFLPVPMAFDVAIAYIAMTHGAPMPYVVAILCTLGIISVFSLSVLGKTISWRLAGVTYATVAALGIVAGVIARGF